MSDDDQQADYKCIKCGDTIGSLEALQRHLSVDHLRWVPYECLYCDVFKATEMELRDHVTARHPDQPVKLAVHSDAANQRLLRKLINQSTTSKSTATPVEMANGALEKNVSSPTRTCRGAIEAERQPIAVKVEFVDLSQDQEEEPSIKLSPPQTPQTENRENAVAQAEKEGHEGVVGKSSARKRRRMSQPLFRDQLDTTRCRLCPVGSDTFKGGPVNHIYNKHMEEDAIFCKYCGASDRYNIGRMRNHISRRHPRDDVDSGVDDKRQQLEPIVQGWMKRCFGTDDNQVTAEATTPENTEPASVPATPENAVETPQIRDSQPRSATRSTHCYVCAVNFSESSQQHIFTKHVKANVWRCKHCDYGTARKDCLTGHLRKWHATADPATSIDDQREKFRQQLEYWRKRCFDEANENSLAEEQPVDGARAGSDSEQPGDEVHMETPDDKENQSEPSESRKTASPSLTVTGSGENATPPSARHRQKHNKKGLCRLCNRVVLANKRHVQIWHLKETLYECAKCGAKSNAAPSAVRQLHSLNGCAAEITDNSVKHQDSLLDLFKSCFG